MLRRSGEPRHLRATGVLRNIVEAAPSSQCLRVRRGPAYRIRCTAQPHSRACAARTRRSSPATAHWRTRRSNRRARQSARRWRATLRAARRTPCGRLGSASKTSPVKHCAPRFPAGRASRSPCGPLTSAGIRAAAYRLAFPRVSRAVARARVRNLHAGHARAGLRRATRPLTVAGAAQVGGVLAEPAPCFPFNRALHARAPRRRQFRSGPHERQESGPHAFRRTLDTRIRGKKRGCYD